MQTRLILLATLLGAALFWGNPVSTQGRSGPREIINGHEAISGDVLVRLRGPLPAAERQLLEQQLDADESQEVGRNLGVLRLHSRTLKATSLLEFLRTHPAIAYAEPNYVLRAGAIPNDPQFGNLWGLLNTGQTVNG